jgi:hypothetical protein
MILEGMLRHGIPNFLHAPALQKRHCSVCVMCTQKEGVEPVLQIRIQIHRVRMILGLLDTVLLLRGTDPDQDPKLSSKNNRKNLDSYCFCDFFMTFSLSKMM